jgi:tRNA dimethylallyltransferase
LVDILSIEEEFDVAKYNTLALAAISDIHQNGRVPVVAGGSGMYMQVLLDGIFEGSVKNESLRADLKKQARQYGNEFLYNKLKEADPQAAQKIHPNDLRRVIRALEISTTENIPISEMHKRRSGLWGKYDITLVGLNCERAQLYEKINARVEKMVEAGLVAEIEKLRGANWSLTARKIIGVEEILGFLNREYTLEQAKELMKLNTRRLAKRQLTWFRKETRLQWLAVGLEESPEEIAGRIISPENG